MAMKSTALALAGMVSASACWAADLPIMAQPPIAPLAAPAEFYRFYVHVGAVGAFVDAAAQIHSPFGRVPGASIKIAPEASAAVEAGYRFTPNWAVSLSGGYPPTFSVDGAGSVRTLGKLGTSTSGPIALTGHYHFTNFGAFQPYVGGGPAYLIEFGDQDGLLTDFRARSAWGAVVQVGADYMVTQRIGLFIDVKKAYLRTTAAGFLGPVPLSANVKLDPLIVSGGITFRL